ncbi:MAG: PKD domain-containing protein [Candidatus Peribacteraceae bacterium]|nr:PKD domain-containing protein [Candidatus Peribacteraceae bacterium]MDD5742462.1 PKD domain-containing protein [Candidatus Peribacteraceae bacterium]
MTPSSPQPIDGIAAPPLSSTVQAAAAPSPQSPKDSAVSQRRFLKRFIIVSIVVPYITYGLWSVYLLMVLPDPTGVYDRLIPVGTMVAVVCAVVLVSAGLFTFLRIGAADSIPLPRRRLAAIKAGGVLLPGLLLSGLTPLAIRREPAIAIIVAAPERAEEMVAPLSVTFSAQSAVDILARRQLTAEKFVWDFEGDGKMNAETADTDVTAYYDRQGQYKVALTIFLKGGATRRVSKVLTITRAVFSVDPSQPILDEPTRLSIAHLVAKKEDIEQAEWDFDGNGEIDLTTKELDVVHTFFAEGPTDVTVKVTLKTKAQQTYERSIEVLRSAPMPFPVEFFAEPEHLIGPAPFGAVFRVQTSEPVRVILWTFGDGAEARGERVGHTFAQRGAFPVTAEVRSEAGPVTKITKVVRVTEDLPLSDLTFSGSPDVRSNKISGEVPVIVDLKPRTTMPLVDFFWEAPEATSVGSTKDSVQAVYRREGTYTLWLIGQDPDGRVMRKPITVEVLPPASTVVIQMDPDGGTSPLTVRFDASETVIRNEQISGFEWTFSDEMKGAAHQQGAQVSHTFQNPGTYEITATVFTTSGKEYSSSKTIVVRAPVIDACISSSRTEGNAPLGIQFFSDCSTLGQRTTFAWDFGDGFSSDQQNPIHDFQRAGSYTVILTLHDGDSLSVSDPITITVQP